AGTEPTGKRRLGALEHAVYDKLKAASRFHALLNEKEPRNVGAFGSLPVPTRIRIVPDAVFARRRHPDLRIARRARTIASLARLISERDVSEGLRNTLVTQARRLQ